AIRIMIGASVGLVAASLPLSISRRRYHIDNVKKSCRMKRRAALIDTVICVLLPLVFVAMCASPSPPSPHAILTFFFRFLFYSAIIQNASCDATASTSTRIGWYPALSRSSSMYFV
ncbi:hypothetical protein DFH06DRAFT_1014994, partial [Mycena polygramma]